MAPVASGSLGPLLAALCGLAGAPPAAAEPRAREPRGPRRAERRSTPRALGASLAIEISPRFAFVATLSFGTPPQPLRCLLDTGSSETWVPSARCAGCGAGSSFDAGASLTFSPVPLAGNGSGGDEPTKTLPVEIDYGTGHVAGRAAEDTVVFGNARISSAPFLVVEEALLPHHGAWDCIVGLSRSGLQGARRPLYERLQEQRQRALFAIVPTGPSDASLVIGEVPSASLEPGSLVWVKSRASGRKLGKFWIVAGSVAAGEHRWHADLALDSGSNMVMMVPRASFSLLLHALLGSFHVERSCYVNPAPGSDDVLCDCAVAEDSSLAALQVVLGGRAFEFGARELFLRVPADDGGERCLLEVQPNSKLLGEGGNGSASAEEREHLWMLGGMFMARYATAFDFDRGSVGFAEAAAAREPTSEVRPWLEEAEALGLGPASWSPPRRPGDAAAAAAAALAVLAAAAAVGRLAVGAGARRGALGCRAAAAAE